LINFLLYFKGNHFKVDQNI